MFRRLGFAVRSFSGVDHLRPLPGNPAASPRARRRGDCGWRTAGPAGWGVASACASADVWHPSCGGRVCRHLHHVEAASSSISTARHDVYRVFPATRMRRMQAPHANADGRTVRLCAGTRAFKWLRAGRMQAGILCWLILVIEIECYVRVWGWIGLLCDFVTLCPW